MNESKPLCSKHHDGFVTFQDTCAELEIVYLISGWHRKSLLGVMIADGALILPILTLNLSVVAVIKRHHSLQTVSNILLACLAVSDFLIGLILIPLVIISIANILQCHSICWLYIFVFEAGYFLAIVSFLTLTLVSVDRYYAISYPYKYQQITASGKLLKCLVICTWLTPTVFVALSFALRKMRLVSQFFMVVAPLSITISIATQFRTLYAVQNVRKRDASTSVGPNDSANKRTTRRKSYMREKAMRVAAMILLATIGCYLPHAVLTMIRSFRGDIFAFQGIYDWTKLLVISNSALNPIIYCLNIRELRTRLLNMVCQVTSSQVHGRKDLSRFATFETKGL